MKLAWDVVGEHYYTTGVDKTILFTYNNTTKKYNNGVAWSGVTGITESPSGAEATKLYADNIPYLNLRSAEEFGASITAYQSPDEFDACDGTSTLAPGVKISQQARQMFGLAYRVKVGNDTEGTDFAYEIHLVYGCTASPSERQRQTVNDSPEAAELSWEITTTPVDVPGFKPTAHVVISSRESDAAKLKIFEDKLYGTDGEGETAGTDSQLLLPNEVAAIFATTTPQG